MGPRHAGKPTLAGRDLSRTVANHGIGARDSRAFGRISAAISAAMQAPGGGPSLLSRARHLRIEHTDFRNALDMEESWTPTSSDGLVRQIE